MDEPGSETAGPDLGSLYSRGFEPVTRTDWFLLTLAALDTLMLLARDVYGAFLPKLVDQGIVAVDIFLVVIFAIDFLTEMSRANNKVAYARNHWYELVGLVPVAQWSFRAFRLVRALRMYVVTHFPPEVYEDRSWHAALVRGVIGHYKGVLLEEITDPIVMQSINVIEGPLTRARFAATVGDSLQERRENIHAVVDRALTETRGVGPLLSTRAGRRVVREVTAEVLDQVILTLRSDELNEVIAASIEDIMEELRERVREKEYRMAGGSLLRPVAR
ncbi:MAG: hypothetical protein R3185_01270 [Candidatus Thermoplasmatota archaeon]|nr:hypothetical protein [Candidatus Thermoplasmatota archaeon]